MANHTGLFAVIAGAATIGLLAALCGLLVLWSDATEFYDAQMDDVYLFKHYSNDAWDILVARVPATGNKQRVSPAAGRSPFPLRKRRYTEDVCSCVESAQLCPPGVSGPPGAPGANGIPGDKGVAGAAGIDYASVAARGGRVGSAPGRASSKRCFTCPPGAAGRAGADGKTGSPGRPGTPGRRGAPGRHGVKGDKGEAGESGPPGKQGVDGPRGPQGQKGIKGTGQPGRPGARGSLGSRGKQGLNGLIGLPGLHGSPGRKGPPGLHGAPGKDGATGPEGYPGLPGQDSDYCVCPLRKDEKAEQGGSTAAPYLLKADVAEPVNYKRREILPTTERVLNSGPAVKKVQPKKHESRRGHGHGRRSVPEAFQVTEFARNLGRT